VGEETEQIKVGLAGGADKLLPLAHHVHGRLRVEHVQVASQLGLVQPDRCRLHSLQLKKRRQFTSGKEQ